MVLLVWPPPDHFWIGRNRGKFCGLSDAAGSPTSARKVPTEIAPARIPGPAAQMRMVSAAEFWPSQQELSRYLKYWLAHGYPSSNPLRPATQSRLCARRLHQRKAAGWTDPAAPYVGDRSRGDGSATADAALPPRCPQIALCIDRRDVAPRPAGD